jgi:hypothetical protein
LLSAALGDSATQPCTYSLFVVLLQLSLRFVEFL